MTAMHCLFVAHSPFLVCPAYCISLFATTTSSKDALPYYIQQQTLVVTTAEKYTWNVYSILLAIIMDFRSFLRRCDIFSMVD